MSHENNHGTTNKISQPKPNCRKRFMEAKSRKSWRTFLLMSAEGPVFTEQWGKPKESVDQNV